MRKWSAVYAFFLCADYLTGGQMIVVNLRLVIVSLVVLAFAVLPETVTAQPKPAATGAKKPAAAVQPADPPAAESEPAAPADKKKPALDPDEIRSTVDALEQERQRQALQELERLRARRNEIEVRAQYARQWVLSHYQFDMYSVIREPQAQDARIADVASQRKLDKESGLLDDLPQQDRERYAKGEKKRRNFEFSPKRMRYNVMKRLEARQIDRDAFLFRLLDRDAATKGSISRGTALNFFLERLGPPAFDHTLYRETTMRQSSLASPQRPAKLLNQGSAGDFVLDESVTRHIRYSRGLIGPKLTGRLSEGPLDLAWPSVLRGDKFTSTTQRIEKAKDQAVAELRAGKPVSGDTADELLEAVNSLYRKVSGEKIKASGDEIGRWVLAERFGKLLIGGAYRLVEARSEQDVVVNGFKTGTIEELLAFMHRNSLQFAEADANGEAAYNTIAEMMIRYYADLEALRSAVAEELKLMGGGHEGALMELSLGDPMKEAQPPALNADGAATVIDELKNFDKTQGGKKPAGKAVPGNGKKPGGTPKPGA